MTQTTYSQRYASGDSNTAGAFAFDSINSVDYAISKVAFGDASTVTRVDASNPLPVTISGVATAANQATGNTHLATIAGAVSGTEVQVDVLTMPTVTIQDGGGSITVDGTVAATQSGSWTVGVSGTVAISAAALPLPSGAATAAKQPALGTAGTASSDVITVQGIASMVALKVDGSAVTQPVSGTVSAAQSGTWTVTGSGGTFPVTDSGGSITVDDGAGSLTVDGSVSITGSVAVTDNSGSLTVDDGGGSITVDGTVTASIAAGATTIAKAEDVASADADVGVPAMAIRKATPANTSGTDGDYEFLQMSAGRLWTSAVIDTALPAGTNAIGKLSSNSGVTIGAVEIAASQTLATVTTVSTVTTCSTVTTLTGGGVAHDSGDSGNPIKIGGKAVTTQSGQTAVASGDRSDLIMDLDGTVISRPFANGDLVSGATSTTGTSDTSVVSAQGAGKYFYCTGFSVSNTGSSTTLVTFKDGSGGSTLWQTIAPTASGSNFSNGGKPLFRTSANTALHFACGTASTTVYVSVTGYKSGV